MSTTPPGAVPYQYAPVYQMRGQSPPSAHGGWIVAMVVAIAVSLIVGFAIGRILPASQSGPASTPGSGPGGVGCPACANYTLNCPAAANPNAQAPQIVAHTGTVAGGPTVSTNPINIVPGSVLLAFVGYVNPSIGGGQISSISDTAGDSFIDLATTAYAQNHSEDIFAADPAEGSTSSVTVSFEDSAATIGGSIGVLDITGAGSPAVVGEGQASGPGPEVAATLGACQANDLFVLGVSGQGHILPFESVQGATLLDSGSADAGPWTDGVGFGTFEAVSTNGSAMDFSMTCGNQASVWESIAVSINPT
jgi:hypothetical protein